MTLLIQAVLIKARNIMSSQKISLVGVLRTDDNLVEEKHFSLSAEELLLHKQVNKTRIKIEESTKTVST